MKWNKLEYGKRPVGKILVKFDVIPGPAYEIGYIDKNPQNNDWYFYCDKRIPSAMSIDSIYDLEPHYILLNEIQMPYNKDVVMNKMTNDVIDWLKERNDHE